jgi:hypothetical protein
MESRIFIGVTRMSTEPDCFKDRGVEVKAIHLWEDVGKKISTTPHVRHPASVLLEVPEGRHNVAHRGNGGTHGAILESPEGRHIWFALCRPSGLVLLTSHIPTARAVGYVLSSLTGLAKMISTMVRSGGQILRQTVRWERSARRWRIPVRRVACALRVAQNPAASRSLHRTLHGFYLSKV